MTGLKYVVLAKSTFQYLADSLLIAFFDMSVSKNEVFQQKLLQKITPIFFPQLPEIKKMILERKKCSFSKL